MFVFSDAWGQQREECKLEGVCLMLRGPDSAVTTMWQGGSDLDGGWLELRAGQKLRAQNREGCHDLVGLRRRREELVNASVAMRRAAFWLT